MRWENPPPVGVLAVLRSRLSVNSHVGALSVQASAGARYSALLDSVPQPSALLPSALLRPDCCFCRVKRKLLRTAKL